MQKRQPVQPWKVSLDVVGVHMRTDCAEIGTGIAVTGHAGGKDVALLVEGERCFRPAVAAPAMMKPRPSHW